MANHQQRPNGPDMTCSRCKENKCNECVDVTLALLGRNLLCTCRRQGHEGEPRDRQVEDPTTGTVISEGAIIDIDGHVSIKRAKIVGEDYV